MSQPNELDVGNEIDLANHSFVSKPYNEVTSPPQQSPHPAQSQRRLAVTVSTS